MCPIASSHHGPEWPKLEDAEMVDMARFEVRADDELLTIDEYCDKYHRSRPTYYRDKAAGRIHVVIIGSSPRIVDRSVRERLEAA